MGKRAEKNLHTLLQEAKTFHEVLDVLVTDLKTKIPGWKTQAKRAAAPQSYADIIKRAESDLGRYEARRRRFEKYQADKGIPDPLRKRIAQLETELLRLETDPSRARGQRRVLAELFDEVDQIKNPPKPLSTKNSALKVGNNFTAASISRAYDAHVWVVLKGHFQHLSRRAKGQQARVEIVASLPEREEYLELKTLHFTRTLEYLADDAYDAVADLGEQLQEIYDNMPSGFQGTPVGEARLEVSEQLRDIADEAVALPDSVAAIRVVHYPVPKQKSRADRAREAATKMQTVAEVIRKYQASGVKLKKAEVAALTGCCEQLESHAADLEGIQFPGMYG